MNILSILGRPGAGKGTQVKLLQEKIGFIPINTGQMLRERAKQNDVLGVKLARILENGLLVPTPVVFSLWMPIMEHAYESESRGVIFDGNPRKFYEAKMLEEVFDMYELSHFRACYIDITEEVAKNRLRERGRTDDTAREIESRLSWFRTEVEPVIKHYEEKGALLRVDGNRSILEVHDDIMQGLQDFLQHDSH
ncbi:MAG: nucleoside monophosphate kinase [bacterium]|nr:nucleoside monophosphate kinase [bacterium]